MRYTIIAIFFVVFYSHGLTSYAETPEKQVPSDANDANAPVQSEASSAASPESNSENSLTQAPTYSCSIHFPLDSVSFSEKRIDECFQGIDPKSISYIHVIATATPAGTNTHNLYLSTRRAGALEGYLRNRYKDTIVHAFGGGENPKSGKMARIIIVTQTPQKKDREKVVIHKPEVVTQYKTVTEIQYKDRPASGWKMSTATGITGGDRAYQFISVSGSKGFKWKSWQNLSAGVKYNVLRSNRRKDLVSTGLFVSKSWLVKKFKYDTLCNFTLAPGLNALFQKTPGTSEEIADTDDKATDYEIGAKLDFVKSRYVVSLETQTGRLFQSYGLGFGVIL